MKSNDERGETGLSIEAKALRMSYREGSPRIHAIRKVSLKVPAGQFLVVRGRSGSGKTTLFHLLAGMRSPSAGRISIGGIEVNTLSEKQSARFRRRNLGLIFQFFNLVPILDVTENIALPLLLEGHRLREVRPRVEALMDRLAISHRAKHSVKKLSGGEMQRVAICRAMVAEPGLVLADEPTGNLDERNAASVLGLLEEICRGDGVTVVVMTHDPGATECCDRVIRLRDGEIDEDLRPS